jgi:ribosome-binding factor A
MDIFVSALKNEEKLAKFLAEYNYEIQKKFNKSVSIRKLPRIRFRLDET